MLQGVQPVKSDFRRLRMTIDGKNAALIPGTVLNDGASR
jgi:hypothetical protein